MRSYWPVRCANAIEVYSTCDAYYQLAQGTKEIKENTFSSVIIVFQQQLGVP